MQLDKQWVDLINTRLVELSAHWRSQGTSVDVTPPSKDLAVDAAPFEAEKMLLGITPLKFPAVATQGVRLASFSGESLVRLTQQDLAAWEEQLNTAFGSGGGGCISSGQSYETDKGRIFVKINKEPDVRVQCFSVFIKFNFAVML